MSGRSGGTNGIPGRQCADPFFRILGQAPSFPASAANSLPIARADAGFFIATRNEKQMRGTSAVGGTEPADGYASVVFLEQSLEKPAFPFLSRKRLNLRQLKIRTQVIKMPAALFLKLNMPVNPGLQISFCASDIHIQAFPKRIGPQSANGNFPVILRHPSLDRIKGMAISQPDRNITFHLHLTRSLPHHSDSACAG